MRMRRLSLLLVVAGCGSLTAARLSPDGSPDLMVTAEPGPTASAPDAPRAAADSASAARADPKLPPEPAIAPPCATLLAVKTAAGGTLAAPDEDNPDTRRIQDAIDRCMPGRSVRLHSDGGKNAFLAGPLTLARGVALWVDAGTTLFASRNARDYDTAPGSCGTWANDDSNGCKPLVSVTVDDAAVVGDGVIDGRGGEPMLGGTRTWWDVAQEANAKDKKHSNPRLIDVSQAHGFTLYRVALHNSPKFHVGLNSAGFVVWGVKVRTPSRPTNSVGKALTSVYARNTDGIDPISASDGVIAYSTISVGDDQIAIKGGDRGPTSNLVIAHNRFGTGHGLSIGSETNGGVSKISVYDLTIDGSLPTGGASNGNRNGLRIKSDDSRGGLVSDVSYRDVCLRDLPNPIVVDPHYSDASGSLIPDFRNILIADVHAIRSGAASVNPVVTLLGHDAGHPLGVALSNVVVDGLAAAKVVASYARVTLGPEPVGFLPAGTGVTVERTITGNAAPVACADRFGSLD
jgi:polygalacturonase